MSDMGIIKPLRDRVRDLEEINSAHQKKNGQLRQEIQDKKKLIERVEKISKKNLIEELKEQIKNPTKKMREQGQL